VKIVFFVMTFVLTVFCFLTILTMKRCIYIDVRPPSVWRFKVWEMLTLLGGLCCVGFINRIGVAGVWRQRLALSVLSRSHLKT
jgi:hypothetical protein